MKLPVCADFEQKNHKVQDEFCVHCWNISELYSHVWDAKYG